MKLQVFKYVCVSIMGASINYFGGVVLSDFMGIKYYIAGLLLLPISFAIGFLLNKYWVFARDAA